jgi:hypothetical protein
LKKLLKAIAFLFSLFLFKHKMFSKISKIGGVARNVSSCRMQSTKVGFIGLGNMGASMAKNLVAAKHEVSVFDLSQQSLDTLKAAGAKISSVKEIAQTCDVIITMLPATKHVQGVLRGPDGIFENAKPGTLLIDSSTIDPLASKALHAEAAGKNLKFLDAPVSGGVTGAAAGTLTFMIGGEDKTLEDAKVQCLFSVQLKFTDILFVSSTSSTPWARTSSTAEEPAPGASPSCATTSLWPSP